MQTNHTGRVTLITLILLAALWAIFPSGNLKHPNLKPGIDMVGGTSLLYEIKPPEGGKGAPVGNLAEQVMESLKKRVDPDGVRNLIWRPQGNTRLEIQMPLSTGSAEAAVSRQAYADAQRKLEGLNVRSGEVLRVVETLKGDARRDRLNQLAMGSEARAKLFGALASTYDQIQLARQKQDAAAQGRAENEYDKLKAQIDDTNLTVAQLQEALEIKGEKDRDAKVAEYRAKASDFSQRQAAIDRFVSAHADYNKVKGNIDDAGDLKRLLRGSGVLEYHILVTDWNTPDAQAMIQRLKDKGPALQAGDTTRWFAVEKPEEFGSPTQTWNDKHWALAWITPDMSMDNRSGKPRWALESAFPTSDEMGARVVGFRFDAQGGKYCGDLTGNNIGKPMAIVLDDKIISAPRINSQIHSEGIITGGKGGYTDEDLRYLISTLNAGSLPAQLAEEPISERTVGSTIGQDNLHRGLMACGFGLIVVAVFLTCYYYVAGIVATFAVAMNMVLILGVMAMLNATFTLPGIAGIVLTIGAAVDANVLIFERLREEQHRGLPLRTALRLAYGHASHAIIDSNATTAITALILYWLGSEEVKGFGLTLLIGLVSSLFTSLFVTRTIFDIMIEKFRVTHLSSLPLTFPKWDKFLKPSIDWIAMAWGFVTFSIIVIVVGCAAFGWYLHKGQLFDIEFASGTAVQFELKDKTPIGDVRNIIEAYAKKSQANTDALPSPSVVSVGNDEKTYEVVTPNPEAPKVRQAILSSLGGRLKLDLPSHFDGVSETFESQVSQTIFPIENDRLVINGFNPPSAATYIGGVAIALNHLDPPLRPSEIKARIERQRLQPSSGEGTAATAYRDVEVESETPGDAPTTSAVVLVSDPNFPYDKDQARWREELAAPTWKLINEAINKPPQLQKVSNFDAQVAGDTTRDAFSALALSIFVIMAYIWLRFGNLKYGTATVIAMIHDTLLVIGAIGLAHLLADTFIGNLLLIEPFRINLTLVASILTIMSYSMIDTIVVFDRIRENRGKYGHLSRQVLNDSINQTLSRTLLTAGTTIVTVSVMYVVGGPGIHGFTFVLLVGILVGTYSSIAIAAPILLLGAGKEARMPGGKTPPVGQLSRVGG